MAFRDILGVIYLPSLPPSFSTFPLKPRPWFSLFLFPPSSHQCPSAPISRTPLSASAPTLLPFCFPGFCSYWLVIQTQRFGAGTHKQERTCSLCFSGRVVTSFNTSSSSIHLFASSVISFFFICLGNYSWQYWYVSCITS